MSPSPPELAATLAAAGFIAADDEAEELLARAAADDALLETLVARRLTGEPLAWITGSVSFCGVEIRVGSGVYVPRWQTEPLVRRALGRLPATGTAVDLCTGSGAVAKVLSVARPGARVVATDIDDRSVACAIANGVEARQGDLFAPLPQGLHGQVDLVIAVVPYVPTPALVQLPRDTLAFESHRSYDGGAEGTDVLRRLLADAPRFLKPCGALLLELGGNQATLLGAELDRLGYRDVDVLVDEDGETRGLEATWRPGHRSEQP